MEPVPYRIRAEDVDEVLTAYGTPEDVRTEAREHVLRQLVDINQAVRTAPETPDASLHGESIDFVRNNTHLRDMSPDRREAALASIEDVLLRDGFVALGPNETRLFPVGMKRDTERDD